MVIKIVYYLCIYVTPKGLDLASCIFFVVPHIKQIQNDKREHNRTLMVLKLICKEVGELKTRHKRHYGEAIIAAVKNDTPEVVRHIIQTFPQSIWITGTTFSQLSIMNRSEKVYNFLVHEVTHEKYFHTISKDKQGNNLLHLAGQLAPPDKLNMVTGAALQMQREFQWFQVKMLYVFVSNII